MRHTHSLLVAALFLALPLTAAARLPQKSTTVADRELVNLTVYNGGIALVHDRRRVALNTGLNRLSWRDVSANIDSTSALVESTGSHGAVTVVESNFNFDLLDPSALLQKYVGRDVVVVHDARFAGERDTRETAKILSTNGGIVLQYRDRIETELRGHIIFPRSPQDFRDRPTLDLDLESALPGVHSLDLSYITGGLTWRADYVGVLSQDETELTLNGIVTLSNTSGAAYDNARLQLVAGNVNIANPQAVTALKTIASVTSRSADSYGVSQENYFEYHLYTLRRPTSILDKQTKQVSLLSAHAVPVRKTLELRGSPYYYQNSQSDLGDRIPVSAYVTFENRGGELGVPLPGGIVRMYKNDSRGLSQFMGSDQIQHTPQNETVRLHMGNSFDVTARKRQTDFKLTGSCTTESSYEIAIRNAKTTAQNVLVVEPIPGDWRIIAENMPHSKSSASTASWTVRVPPAGRSTLTYSARTTWCR